MGFIPGLQGWFISQKRKKKKKAMKHINKAKMKIHMFISLDAEINLTNSLSPNAKNPQHTTVRGYPQLIKGIYEKSTTIIFNYLRNECFCP